MSEDEQDEMGKRSETSPPSWRAFCLAAKALAGKPSPISMAS
jgi:hypothetical protein